MIAFISEEQALFQESVNRLLRDTYDRQKRKVHASGERGWSLETWRSFAELGVLGAILPEEYGGSGGGGIELMLIMEALGAAAALEPFVSSIVLCGTALQEAAPPAIRDEWLPRMAAGETWLAWAHSEAAARHDDAFVETRASQRGSEWVLSGSKTIVRNGHDAEAYLVTARVGGAVDSADGLALFLIGKDADGLSKERLRLHDASSAANLVLDNVVGTPLGQPGSAWAAIREVLDWGIVASLAESVGAMDASLKATVEYLKLRKQFGVTIGSNQALQHRAADMLVALEQARSMALLAALSIGSPPSAERARRLSRAKMLVGRNGRFLSQEAVQLHGGIGVTEEAGLGDFFRRLMVNEQMFGDPNHHLRILSNELAVANN